MLLEAGFVLVALVLLAVSSVLASISAVGRMALGLEPPEEEDVTALPSTEEVD